VTPQHLSWLLFIDAAHSVRVEHVPIPAHVNRPFWECLRAGLIHAEVRYTLTDKGRQALQEAMAKS
jgi:hypothetical protein